MMLPIDRARRHEFNRRIIEKSIASIFATTVNFSPVKMVNFSSLHDEGRPIESFHHYRRDKLLIPRQNGGNMVDFDLFFTFICTFTYYLALYPTLPNPSTVLEYPNQP
jgi:hypothetical protein